MKTTKMKTTGRRRKTTDIYDDFAQTDEQGIPTTTVNRTATQPHPNRPQPAFGAFVVGLLRFQHQSVRVCYGCRQKLKPEGGIPEAPEDLIFVSGDRRTYFDERERVLKQNQHVSNVYFHFNPNCVAQEHKYFIPGLVKVPEDLHPFLQDEHKEKIRQIIAIEI